ncbi:MAG TPA: DMT family transporter [Bacteroidales bacterium]|nr:DMT family transporter [Bacteroidales bacterium]
MIKRWVKTRAHLAILAANIIYGVNYSIVKDIVPGHIKPFALLTLRSVIGAALFWGTSLFLPKEKVKGKDLLYIFAISFFGVVINQIAFLTGISLTSPINSSILLATNPIFAFVFAALILKEKITFLSGLGLTIGFSGVMMLILQNGTPDISNTTFLGDFYSLINSVSWAFFTVIIKRMLEKYSPVTVMKWVFFFGMFTNIPVGHHEWSTADWSSIPVISWLEIGFVIVFATYLGYLLLIYGLKTVSPTVVSIYTYLQPALAAYVATLMGQDTVDFVMIMSAVLIFSGVYVVSKQKQAAG